MDLYHVARQNLGERFICSTHSFLCFNESSWLFLSRITLIFFKILDIKKGVTSYRNNAFKIIMYNYFDCPFRVE